MNLMKISTRVHTAHAFSQVGRRVATLVLLALSCALPAQAAGPISIENGWSRATAAAQTVGGGFMTIVNAGKADDRLVSATSPVAVEVQIHDMKMEDGVMRMRQLADGLAVPAGARVELKPRSLHLMFMQLKAPLAVGQSFPVTLKFEKAGAVTTQFRVEAMGAAAPAKKPDAAPHHQH